MTDWTDQVAIVTGSSRGIGRAIARALAARGAAICINYATRAAEAEAAASEIAATGGRVIAIQADIADADAVTAKRGLAMGGGRPAERRFTAGGSGKSVARYHRTVLVYWKFESISLHRRVRSEPLAPSLRGTIGPNFSTQPLSLSCLAA
jgi:hypothetical protein